MIRRSYNHQDEQVTLDELDGVAAVRVHPEKRLRLAGELPWIEAPGASFFQRTGWRLVPREALGSVDPELELAKVFVDGEGHLRLGPNAASAEFDEALSRTEVDRRLETNGMETLAIMPFAPTLRTVALKQAGLVDTLELVAHLRRIPGCILAEPLWLEALEVRAIAPLIHARAPRERASEIRSTSGRATPATRRRASR